MLARRIYLLCFVLCLFLSTLNYSSSAGTENKIQEDDGSTDDIGKIGIEETLKKGDSAFDEIEQFNDAVDLEHRHIPGFHLIEGDILENEDSSIQSDFTKSKPVGIPLVNNYHAKVDHHGGTGTIKNNLEMVNIFQKINEEKQKLLKDNEKGAKRGVIRDEMKLWRTRTIPYVIHQSREDVRIEIENGMREISSQTCLRFVQQTDEKNYVKFAKGRGCWSLVGQQGGEQIISIGNGCERKEVVAHEILHSLGFYHEQNRFDRNKYVNILWKNIKPNMLRQFRQISRTYMDDLDLPYDLKSVLHYGNKAFSGNDGDTMRSKKYPKLPLGNSKGLSQGDVDDIKALYKCDELPIGGFGKWNNFPCFDNLVRLRYRICYGQTDDVCEGHGVRDGLQVMRETCGRYNVKAYMEGCYNFRSSNMLPFQRRASRAACASMTLDRTAEDRVKAYKVCAVFAKANKIKKFGITNNCYCWYGNDDIDLKTNGPSQTCQDGSGYQQAIYLYIIEYKDEEDI